MADCELRQRKKEDIGDPEDAILKDKIESTGREHIKTENKPESVRVIFN